MLVENTYPPTPESPADRITVAADFVQTVGGISYLIDVSDANIRFVRSSAGDFYLRVIDNSLFRCPDKKDDFSMSSFVPKKQYTLYKIVSESFRPIQASHSDILAGVETFYMYEHYFTVLKRAIEFATNNKINFINDATTAETEYHKLIGDPKQYTTDLEKLRAQYKKASSGDYLRNPEYIAAKHALNTKALCGVAGLRYTALLKAAKGCGLGAYDPTITDKLGDLYQQSVGTYCVGGGREVPKMPISMFASFADLCV
jgi:hypothetical protein